VGQLQLEVVQYRLKNEYDVDARLAAISCSMARWVSRRDGGTVDFDELIRVRSGIPVVDVRGRPVLLFEGEWQMNFATRYLPDYVLAETAHGVVRRE
jgi:peptide chain release factor 3